MNKQRRTFYLLLGYLLLTVDLAQAQVRSLPQLLEQSKQNYPLLKAKQSETVSASKRVNAAQTDYLPTVLLNSQYTVSSNNNMTGSFYPNDAIGISTTGAALPQDNYQGVPSGLSSLAIDWRVFNFGKVRAGLNVAKQNEQVAQSDYENELFQHQVRVIDLYLNVLTAQKIKKAQESNLQRANDLRLIVASNARSGLKPGVDSMMANVEYARAQIQLLQSKNTAKVASIRLAEATGSYLEDLEIDTMLFAQKSPVYAPQTAIDRHPRLRLYRQQVEASKARSKAAKLNYLPSLSVVASGLARGSGNSRNGSGTSYDASSGLSYGLYNYLLGLSFRWNITGLARIKSDYGSEKYLADRYQYLYEEQELQLKRQTGEATAQWELAREQARIAPIELSAARSAYLQAKARYENGLADILSFNQNYYLLNRAEVDYYIAAINLWKSLLIQSASTGDLSLFLGQIQ